jgi:hypothetical protein
MPKNKREVPEAGYQNTSDEVHQTLLALLDPGIQQKQREQQDVL